MRIVIDMQGMQTGSKLRGIGRYTLSLSKAIVRNRGKHEIILLLCGLMPKTIQPIRLAFEGLLPLNNIRVWEALGPVAERNSKNTWRREASEFIREAYLTSLNPDFILLTTLFEGFSEDFVGSVDVLEPKIPTALIFYDLIPFIYSDFYLTDPSVMNWYKNKISQCKRMHLLLAISESSKQEAIEYLEINENSIVNISAAVDLNFKPFSLSNEQNKEIRSKYGIFKNFLMYSSATDVRKNHLYLIKAYSQLPGNVRDHHQLVFVGGLPKKRHRKFLKYAKRCGMEDGELIVTGWVAEEDMIVLYNLCKAFVFPSWHEGFGLPVLEAMKCGSAVIASNVSSLPEVIGRTDALFDPFDESSIMAKINQVLTDDGFREELERYGLKQAEKFSWDVSARKATIALEEILASLESRGYKSESNVDLLPLLIESIAKLPYPCSESDLLRSASAIEKNCQ